MGGDRKRSRGDVGKGVMSQKSSKSTPQDTPTLLGANALTVDPPAHVITVPTISIIEASDYVPPISAHHLNWSNNQDMRVLIRHTLPRLKR